MTPSRRDPATVPAPGPGGRRPPVVVSGTGAQALALLLALMTVGLFVGSAVFHTTDRGDAWARRSADCLLRFPVEPAAGLEAVTVQSQRLQECLLPATSWLVATQLAGVAVAVLATAAAALLAPVWLVRRRGWRAWPDGLEGAAERVGSLAAELGLPRPPGLMLGPARQRDAVTFGLPGHYRVVLPPALAVRPSAPAFATVVRHELVHAARHDVLIAWSTRPALRVVAGLLAVPLVQAAVRRDGSILVEYGWRAVLLLLVTTLVCARILRTREYEADAASAPTADLRGQLAGLLGRLHQPERRGLRRLLAFHPDPAQRAAAVEDAGRRPAVALVDVVTVALLTALAVQALEGFAADRGSWTGAGGVLIPALAGVTLGCALGPGLLRAAAGEAAAAGDAGRAAAGGRWVARAVGGTFVGYAAGAVASLANLGASVGGALWVPTTLLQPLMVAGAVALAAALAQLVAGGAGPAPDPAAADRDLRRSARGHRVVMVLLVAAALWFADLLGIALGAGPRYAVVALVTVAGAWGVVVVLLVTTPWCWRLVRRAADRPGGGATLGYGLTATAVSMALIVLHRLLQGASTGPAEAEGRLYLYTWLLGLAGLGVAVGLVTRAGARGLAVALAAAPTTTAFAGVVFSVYNAALGGDLQPLFVLVLALQGQGLVYVLVLATALVWAAAGALREGRGAGGPPPGGRARRRAAAVLVVVTPLALGSLVLALAPVLSQPVVFPG